MSPGVARPSCSSGLRPALGKYSPGGDGCNARWRFGPAGGGKQRRLCPSGKMRTRPRGARSGAPGRMARVSRHHRAARRGGPPALTSRLRRVAARRLGEERLSGGRDRGRGRPRGHGNIRRPLGATGRGRRRRGPVAAAVARIRTAGGGKDGQGGSPGQESLLNAHGRPPRDAGPARVAGRVRWARYLENSA